MINVELTDVNHQHDLGFDSSSVSQLSRKNQELGSDLLSRKFLELVQLIHTKTYMKKRNISVNH